jgi:hypothetical protein
MNVHRKGPLAIAVGGLLFALLPGATAGATPKAALPSDFNGDGYADLAIGVPDEDVGTRQNAGSVNVLYGSSTGLTAGGDQSWSQDSARIIGASERYDRFGETLASGDFDRDGYADLAVGVPGEEHSGGGFDVGAVAVLHGSASGLAATSDQLITAGAPEISVCCGAFGSSLAAADFDGDGYWDLAVGSRRPVDGLRWAGAVEILFGSPIGLMTNGRVLLSQATAGVPGDPAEEALFGDTLAAGDLDGDGYADLAASVKGGVITLYGEAAGVDGARGQLWDVGPPALSTPRVGDFNLEVGDFDGDGRGDLAIGDPYEELQPGVEIGAVDVLYGSPTGLTADSSQRWHQDVPGVPGANEEHDRFGSALAAGDFDGDGRDDLAIGVRAESFGSVDSAGDVIVLRGSAAGLTATGAVSFSQNSPGVPNTAETNDRFGSRLASANYGRSRYADLVVGVRDENVGRIKDAGMINVLYGRSTGLSGMNAQGWSQDSTGVLGNAEEFDYFGSALTP